jgi:hypothetical protein
MNERESMEKQLTDLQGEHRDLDGVISQAAAIQPYDQLRLQRLKKRKLRLRDEISQLESKLLPDIIA